MACFLVDFLRYNFSGLWARLLSWSDIYENEKLQILLKFYFAS